jgi:hypothetical protein
MTNLDSIEEWNAKNQEKMDQFDEKQEKLRQQRAGNLENLYKEIDYDALGYVDYDDETFEENINILNESMNMIKEETSDANVKRKMDEYLKLTQADTNIYPATSELSNVQQMYSSII